MMKSFRLIFSIVTAAFAALGCMAADEIYGYDLNVGEFDRLKVVDHVNVNYVCNSDSAGHAVFNASRHTASMMMFQNDGGRLSIRLSSDVSGVIELPTVTVYSTFLTKAENSGDSTLRVLNMAPLPAVSLTLIGNGRIVAKGINTTKLELTLLTGNGTIVADGKCQEEAIKFTGTGLIQADGVEAETVSVRSWGTGSIGCWPTKQLNVGGVGSSKIYFKGTPEIKNRSVGLKVISMDER